MIIVMWILGVLAALVACVVLYFKLLYRTLRRRDAQILYTSMPRHRGVTVAQLQLLAQARWPGISYERILDTLWRAFVSGTIKSDQPDDFSRVLNRDALWFVAEP